MNESVFRSPKWLRNFIDFEVNTGVDQLDANVVIILEEK